MDVHLCVIAAQQQPIRKCILMLLLLWSYDRTQRMHTLVNLVNLGAAHVAAKSSLIATELQLSKGGAVCDKSPQTMPQPPVLAYSYTLTATHIQPTW